jgi:hypothetical protein
MMAESAEGISRTRLRVQYPNIVGCLPQSLVINEAA